MNRSPRRAPSVAWDSSNASPCIVATALVHVLNRPGFPEDGWCQSATLALRIVLRLVLGGRTSPWAAATFPILVIAAVRRSLLAVRLPSCCTRRTGVQLRPARSHFNADFRLNNAVASPGICLATFQTFAFTAASNPRGNRSASVCGRAASLLHSNPWHFESSFGMPRQGG